MSAVRSPFFAAGLAALIVLILIGVADDSVLFAVPAALGAAVLVGQLGLQRLASVMSEERDEALPLLQSAIPKLRAGVPLDTAFILAAQERPAAVSQTVSAVCARARMGFDLDGKAAATGSGALAPVLIAMIAACRASGGDVARPFASLATMIETDQRLRLRQSIASLHVRAQANALLAIAAIVLALTIFGNQESLSFLSQTQDGRRILTVCLTSMLWGYVAITALTAAIASD